MPGLALSWEQTSPLKWRFKLRQGVKFHDGAPFTADDVVFSIIRAQQPTSQIAVYANAVGTPKKIDDYTVEFELPKVNPIFLEHVQSIFIMNKAWCEAHKATKPQDFKNKEEAYTALNANGTGPYILVKREPGIRTTWKRNPNYWAKPEGNVQEVVFTPIGNDATRTAALVSGELDFILDPPPRDVAKLRNTAGVKIIDGPENRIVFIGMDQFRDELINSNIKGKNPFKDVRVRRALYHAVDIETMKTKLMSGQSFPTGGMTPSPKAAYNDPKIEARAPFDLELAKKLMAEAGYPNGFEVQLDCPNNRYINDEEICIALAGMWDKIGVKVKVVAHSARDLLPQAGEVRDQHVHARLGRRRHRCRNHADACDAQPGHGRHRLVQLRPLHQRQVRRPGRALERRGRPGQAQGAGAGRADRVEGAGAHHPAAPAGDPLGRAVQRDRGAPRRQLPGLGLGHDSQVGRPDPTWLCSSPAASGNPCRRRATGRGRGTRHGRWPRSSPSWPRRHRPSCAAASRPCCRCRTAP